MCMLINRRRRNDKRNFSLLLVKCSIHFFFVHIISPFSSIFSFLFHFLILFVTILSATLFSQPPSRISLKCRSRFVSLFLKQKKYKVQKKKITNLIFSNWYIAFLYFFLLVLSWYCAGWMKFAGTQNENIHIRKKKQKNNRKYIQNEKIKSTTVSVWVYFLFFFYKEREQRNIK